MNPSGFNMDEAMENIKKLAESGKREPSSDTRAMAATLGETFQAMLDEGFRRSEALFIATLPMREAVIYYMRKEDEEE